MKPYEFYICAYLTRDTWSRLLFRRLRGGGGGCRDDFNVCRPENRSAKDLMCELRECVPMCVWGEYGRMWAVDVCAPIKVCSSHLASKLMAMKKSTEYIRIRHTGAGNATNDDIVKWKFIGNGFIDGSFRCSKMSKVWSLLFFICCSITCATSGFASIWISLLNSNKNYSSIRCDASFTSTFWFWNLPTPYNLQHIEKLFDFVLQNVTSVSRHHHHCCRPCVDVAQMLNHYCF